MRIGMGMWMGDTPITHPTTFNHEGVLWQKSAFSKNVLGWPPLPIKNQVDSDNNNLGESTMIQEKVINNQ